MRRGASRPKTRPRPAGAGFSVSRRRRTELALFLRRWLAHPLHIGAIAPSAPALARAMARAAQTELMDGELVVELGPGTGSVTRALLATGVPEERLVLVERDRYLHEWLKEQFPGANVLLSDARQLDELLPAGQAGRVSTVVSSLPLNSLPRNERDEIVRVAFRVLSGNGSLVQYSYGVPSPPAVRSTGADGAAGRVRGCQPPAGHGLALLARPPSEAGRRSLRPPRSAASWRPLHEICGLTASPPAEAPRGRRPRPLARGGPRR